MIITNLLTNMVVVTFAGAMHTNTPAFRDFAYEAVLTNAQVVAAKWRLDRSAISAGNVTRFAAAPLVEGYDALIVFGGRYRSKPARQAL